MRIDRSPFFMGRYVANDASNNFDEIHWFVNVDYINCTSYRNVLDFKIDEWETKLVS